MLKALNNNKRMLLALVVTLFVASNFWLGSRYPSLSEKAYMGGEMKLDALGFDVVIEVAKDDPLYFRIAATTVNWTETNRQGMTFGIILAACLMTILSLVKRRSFNSSIANSALGALVGTPLGVCVNCAAPIARGMHSAGARLETTLAMLLSSPTMNVIVLTMLFALFPWYMAVTKIALTLAFILLGIPLLSRYVFGKEVTATRDARLDKQSENPFMWQTYDEEAPAGGERWLASVLWVGKTFLRHLWFIVKTTVPLMLLAGLLGAAAISVLPWNSLAEVLPTDSILNAGLGMLGVAVLGLFLPVPIAFDVVVAAVLMAAGMPPYYVMVLLFTLGIFSVYSFAIVWAAISRRVAVVLSASLVVLGVGAGFAAAWADWAQLQSLEKLALKTLGEAPPRLHVPGPAGTEAGELLLAMADDALIPAPYSAGTTEQIEIRRIPFAQNSNPGRGAGFTRYSGENFGIRDLSEFTAMRTILPSAMGRGIATGDVHNDGWPDIVVAENRSVGGLTLYANRAGKTFEAQRIDIPELANLTVLSVALVDINDDGWLDIFFTTYLDGNFLLINARGRFVREAAIPVASDKNTNAMAISFGDIEQDGDLDAIIGNWTLGDMGRQTQASRNYIMKNTNPGLQLVPMGEIVGETLTVMLSDMNADGFLDVFIGNDFEAPDYFYFGVGGGRIKQVKREQNIIPHTTTTTMTIAVADIDNDLTPEIYIGEIARGVGEEYAEFLVDRDAACEEFDGDTATLKCIAELAEMATIMDSTRRRDVSLCLGLSRPDLRAECIGFNALWVQLAAKKEEGFNPAICKSIPGHMRELLAMCRELSRPVVRSPASEFEGTIPQIRNHNVLLFADPSGVYVDKAIEKGVALGGWSWNAKFADLDNDGWKDIYIATGLFQSKTREPNVFYLNDRAGGFTNKTDDYGLGDLRATGAYSYIDFDNDGDLDIVTVPIYGNVQVFVNNTAGRNAIAFELRDHKGNRFGIGSKVIIRYGDNAALNQMVEIQAGGGFLSFDAPLAHFGLGAHKGVNEIEIQWSTGGSSVIRAPFAAGARYVVTRQP